MADDTPIELIDLDRVIHEPARLLIVAMLAGVRKADFVYLHEQTGLTRGNLSSHMSRLEKEGYVVVDKTFVDQKPRTTYHLTAEGKRAWKSYRRRMQKLIG